jgi:hypothetical protein
VIKAIHTETKPDGVQETKLISVQDKASIKKNFYFQKGRISVLATDYDGWGEGKIDILRLTDNEYKSIYGNSYGSIRKGTISQELPPGTYKLKVIYTETKPDQTRGVGRIVIADHDELFHRFYFGKGRVVMVGSDGDGWVSGKTDIHRSVDGDWKSIYGNSYGNLSKGTVSAYVPPGTYKAKIIRNDPKTEVQYDAVYVGDRIAVRFMTRFHTDERIVDYYVADPETNELVKKEELPDVFSRHMNKREASAIQRVVSVRTKSSERQGLVSSILDKGLDYSLERSGIDSTSREAELSKRLAKNWMNPFATQEQIDKDLQDIRDLFK